MSDCAFGVDCSVYDSVIKTPGIRYLSPICEGCRGRSVGLLRSLRLDYVGLSQALPRSDSRGQTKIFRPRPESSPPIDVAVFTLRHQIAHACRVAEAAVRDTFGGDGPRVGAGVREGFAMSEALVYLEARVEALAGLGVTEGCWDVDSGLTEALSGPQVLMWLARLHDRALLLLGLSARKITVPGYCGHCGHGALARRDDDESRVWCDVCKKSMDSHTYSQVIAGKSHP